MNPPADSATRFSDRVESYDRYRPDYPAALVDFLGSELGADRAELVADVGAGTGKLTLAMLSRGWPVAAVEPNGEMRERAESACGSYPKFRSLPGSAEDTGLEPGSVDLVVVAQAFHWFRPEPTRSEFARILKPGGRVALIYNERDTRSAFLADYEALLQSHAKRYGEANHRNVDDAALGRFFGAAGFSVFETGHEQRFDLEGLIGRYLSSSYSFNRGEAGFDGAAAALEALFYRRQVEGAVGFSYRSVAYYGRI